MRVLAAVAATAVLLTATACNDGQNRVAAAPAPTTGPSATGGAALPPAAASAAGSARPTAASSATGAGRSAAPARAAAAACDPVPAGSYWRAEVSRLPRHARSATYVASIGTGASLTADFGSGQWDGGPIGIPVTVAPAGTPSVPVRFDYADESDRGPYRIPRNAKIEGGPSGSGDRHIIVYDPAACRAYELFDAHPAGNGWQAGSGAVYDLHSQRLRPDGWTSADAAGLPILPGLVRYEEVAAGHVDHAVRITVPRSQAAHLWPARHHAGRPDSALPPMGLRLRLRAGVDPNRFPPQARAVVRALQTYGAIVADNGSAWYVSGAPDQRWNNDQLQTLKRLKGSDFEAVDATGLMVNRNSAAARS
ncbi:hypothetical protein [Krasilnikovia sp. MM14-A1259]|uniref:hypothetical protein n=1 Tax=Krasilnikovia sp. MM14-A1259 TaxID=3373539 RepID=UPI00399C8FA4